MMSAGIGRNSSTLFLVASVKVMPVNGRTYVCSTAKKSENCSVIHETKCQSHQRTSLYSDGKNGRTSKSDRKIKTRR